jgi:hypothetical protein
MREEGVMKKVGVLVEVLNGTVFWPLHQYKMQQFTKFLIHVLLSAAVCTQ